ncbi:hypothetical protein Q644_24325 [Brucella intermedia 229E]|uniref:Twin-arginine translocation signal domain-containing protein n=1 Tax=Brucella intermedia 229E TaxID=1337887 RepID=U4VDN9_9HYPH|nr:hypothetical protein Q644_24325 [Brucella intermedia 229E]
MNVELSRRQFLGGTGGAVVAASALGSFGFGAVESAYAETIRPFKLTNTTETRNTCLTARSPAASSSIPRGGM